MSTAPVEEPPDLGHAAHVAACAHLSRCWEQLDAEEEAPDELDDGEHIEAAGDELDTAGPFCGCQDCEVREVLHAAFPVLLAGLVDHLLTTGHAEAAHELQEAF